MQILVKGQHTLSKIKSIVGDKNPKLAAKNTLRSFYGADRFDNAFFVSETFPESIIEHESLFED